MRISYNWLKTFVELKESPEEVARILTSLGFETSVHPANRGFKDIIIGKVISKEPHPNAQKLSVCEVSTSPQENNSDRKIYKVVCGAPNVAAGQIVPLALPGSKVGDITLQKTTIRGVASEGMICSSKELGITEDSPEGIMVLSPDTETKIGMSLDLIYQPDSVLEIEPLPNRPDVLSCYGIAMELSTRLGRPLTLPPIYNDDIPPGSPLLEVDIELKNSPGERPDCPCYVAVSISGFAMTSNITPEWMKNRLLLSGLRPINFPTDVTNYVLLEMGHPLHAFDKKRLLGADASSKIFVRYGINGEKILALDGRTYTLESEDIVISSGKNISDSRPAAIAGVIGGEETAVTNDTTAIVLESAVFNPSRIFKTRRRLKIQTESSYRFERGMSRRRAILAAKRACYLFKDIAGKNIRFEAYFETVKEDYFQTPKITLFYDRIKSYAGLKDIPETKSLEILSSLGFSIEHPRDTRDFVIVSPPEERIYDIKIQEDVIEEIVRVYGYENFTSTQEAGGKDVSPPLIVSHQKEEDGVKDSDIFKFENELRRLLKYTGYWEEVNYGMIDGKGVFPGGWFRFFDEKKCYLLENPISPEMSVLRPSLFCELWKNFVARYVSGESEWSRGEHSLSFEIGNVFYNGEERRMLGLIGAGNLWRSITNSQSDSTQAVYADFYFLKNTIERIARLVSSKDASLEFVRRSPDDDDKNNYLAYKIDIFLGDSFSSDKKHLIGTAGPVAPRLALESGIKSPVVWWAEIDIYKLCQLKWQNPAQKIFEPYPPYPPAVMDFSFFMPSHPKDIPSIAQVEKEIRSVVASLNGKLVIDDIYPIDLWQTKESVQGEKTIPKNSITIRLIARSWEGTLEAKELKILSDGIIKCLTEKFGVVMRTMTTA